ncbi:MAG: protein kinase domain-containing protein [Myxococcota bacterium]
MSSNHDRTPVAGDAEDELRTDRDGLPPAPHVLPPQVPARDPLVGRTLDNRYRVLELVAKGGMGRVYRAEQAPLGRTVALKVLDVGQHVEDDQEFRKRFFREAAACAKLSHPNTIRIFDYGRTAEDVLYIAMEYVQGRTLHTVIHQEAPLALDRVVDVAKQVASSLREAHELGLVHRDLKPSNVLLVRHGDGAEHVKVVDFGLVKELRSDSDITRADSVVGSPSYMSPEQIKAEAVDQRSDIYALGVVMYACLAGKTPFTGTSSVNVLMAHLHQAPPPLAERCPAIARAPTLEWTVMTCLAKRPDDRFRSVDELLRALRACDLELRGQLAAKPMLLGGRVTLPDDPTPMAPDRVSLGPSSPRVAPPEPSDSLVMRRRQRAVLPWVAAAGLAVLGLGALGVAAVLLGVLLSRDDPESAPAPEPVLVAPVPERSPEPAPAASPAPADEPATEAAASKPKSRPRATSASEPAPSPAPVATKPEPSPAPATQPAPPKAEPRKTGSDVRDPWGE